MEIRDFVYHEKEVPNSWDIFFMGSVEGKTYKILVDENKIVMSNSEFEERTNKIILDEASGDVLMIGLGLNFVNDRVLNLDKVNSVDTIEISQWVIDNVPTKTHVIFGDYKKLLLEKKYDIIWFDANDSYDEEKLKSFLKPGGRIIKWSEKTQGGKHGN